MLAIMSGNLEISSFLIEKNINIDLQNVNLKFFNFIILK